MVAIRPRSAWGAVFDDGAGPAPLPATDGAFLHHSTGAAKDGPEVVRALEAIGEQRFQRGISYTFAVSPDGTIWTGHSINRRGAHTKGHNSTARAICLMGNYSDKDPTPQQRESVALLLAHGVRQGWWPNTRLRGHRDVGSTECPGNKAYPLLAAISARAEAVLRGGAAIAPDGPPTRSALKQGDEGEDVKFLQAMLNIVTPKAKLGDRTPLEGDGDFGPRTAARVKEFQVWANGMLRLAGVKSGFLDEDGVADAATLASVAFWVPGFLAEDT